MTSAFWNWIYSRFRFSLKKFHADQPRMQHLSPIWSKNCANWLKIQNVCKWHLIILKLMANVKDSTKLFSIWVVHWKPKTRTIWKDYLPHASARHTIVPTIILLTLVPTTVMYGCKPRLPIDIWFGLNSPQSEEHSHNKFLAKHSAPGYGSAVSLPTNINGRSLPTRSDGIIRKWEPPDSSLVTTV